VIEVVVAVVSGVVFAVGVVNSLVVALAIAATFVSVEIIMT